VLKAANKQRIAALLKRIPWAGVLAMQVWRTWQPWVTVGAVGAVFNDEGRLLIVEHVYHPKFPWGLPGGWMSRNEDPDQTVRREVLEETALRVEVIKPLIVMHTQFLARHLDIAYLCYAPPNAGEVHLSGELLAYQWADPADLPPMPLFHQRTAQAAIVEHQIVVSQNNKGLKPLARKLR